LFDFLLFDFLAKICTFRARCPRKNAITAKETTGDSQLAHFLSVRNNTSSNVVYGVHVP